MLGRHVGVQGLVKREGLGAPGALVGSFAGVAAQVRLEIGHPVRNVGTIGTRVTPLVGVGADMGLQELDMVALKAAERTSIVLHVLVSTFGKVKVLLWLDAQQGLSPLMLQRSRGVMLSIQSHLPEN